MAYQPVVAVVGHVDHGKSTLLDAIRKGNTTEKEVRGITQRIGAYEVVHKTKEGAERRVSFIDTPGHEAFGSCRACAGGAADIAILVVAVDEGVKPQTVECIKLIVAAQIPFVVALTKVDKPGANAEWAKQSLAEHEVFVEGYGGSVPCALVSATTGAGLAELLDLVLLLADLNEKPHPAEVFAHGVVLEAERSKTRGACATLVVKGGKVSKGAYLASDGSFSGIRIMEDWAGISLGEAGQGRIVRVCGWNGLPEAGALFRAYENKREAEAAVERARTEAQKPPAAAPVKTETDAHRVIPLVIRADAAGSIQALQHEIEKAGSEKVSLRIVSAGLGNINEGDLRASENAPGTLVLGFGVEADTPAQRYAKATGKAYYLFDLIYRLADFLAEEVKARTPKEMREEVAAQARILKIFSEEKNTQIVGGKVLAGTLAQGNEFRIIRRGERVGEGKVKELQKQRERIREAPEGMEFGASVAPSLSLAVSDIIEVARMVEV